MRRWSQETGARAACDCFSAMQTAPPSTVSTVRGRARRVIDFPETFDSLLTDWTRQHGALPAILCGMVGSSFGWAQAPYLPCPARPEQIAGACVALRAGRVRIIPGLSCRNRLDAPDLMRGEETQILGALRLDPALRRGQQLLCLPGTHTKWVLLDEGTVREFLTATTGELFALLCAHSVLVSDSPTRAQSRTIAVGPAFIRAVGAASALSGCGTAASNVRGAQPPLEQRARRPMTPPAYLSGLMIASDVSGALALLATAIATPGPHHRRTAADEVFTRRPRVSGARIPGDRGRGRVARGSGACASPAVAPSGHAWHLNRTAANRRSSRSCAA